MLLSIFLPPGQQTAFTASAGILHGVALLMAVFRIASRWKRKIFSWDDGLAFLAGFFDLIFFGTLFLKIVETGREQAGHPLEGTEAIVSYLTRELSYTSTVWSARLSIALGIMRVLPACTLRYAVIGTIIYFLMTWITLAIFNAYLCLRTDLAHDGGHCVLAWGFVVSKLCLGIAANTLLVGLSVWMMWRSKLPHIPRRMIRAIFGLNILITPISVVHIVAQLKLKPFLAGFTGHYESAVTLMACNLLVVAAVIYRKFHTDEEASSTTTSFTWLTSY